MSLRVLMVDDSPIDRSVYRAMLDQALPGLQIDEVGGAHEAIGLLRSQRYDCVLLDFEMPDGDGLMVLKTIQPFNHSPVVIVTSHDEAELAAASLRAGAVDYLVKDRLEAGQLAAAVQEAVMHQQQRQAREDRQRRAALLQALVMQSEELILVVDLATHQLVEAGTAGLAHLGVRRANVIDRDVRTLAMFGPGGWAAFAAAVTEAPTPLPAATPGVRFEARAQTITIDTVDYMVILARIVPP